MAKNKKLTAADQGVADIIQGIDRKPKGKTQSTTLSVRMPIEEVEKFIAAAKELEVTKAELQAFIIRKFLKDWDEGKRPEKQKKTIEVLKVE